MQAIRSSIDLHKLAHDLIVGLKPAANPVYPGASACVGLSRCQLSPSCCQLSAVPKILRPTLIDNRVSDAPTPRADDVQRWLEA